MTDEVGFVTMAGARATTAAPEIGTLEASRFCPGRKNYEMFEINGSKGSMRINLVQE